MGRWFRGHGAVLPGAAVQVFVEQSMPIIEYYEKFGKVRQINADRSPEEIYKEVEALFKDF